MSLTVQSRLKTTTEFPYPKFVTGEPWRSGKPTEEPAGIPLTDDERGAVDEGQAVTRRQGGTM